MTDGTRLTAAVVGLGQMGRGIARKLDEAGVLTAAWDISDATRAAAGLSPAVALVPPQELGGRADVTLLVVPSSREIGAMLGALVAAERPGQILVDLTTSDPAATLALAAEAARAGRRYLDCGMSGGAAGADAGRLTLMVGVEADTLARVRPLLDVVANRIHHVGPQGAGHTVKLIHNMVCHTNFLTLCEAGRLAERAGIDLSALVGAVNAGNARSFISERRFPDHILSGTFDGRSRVANLAKDLGMARDFARSLGMTAPYGALTSRLLDRAVAAGRRDDDFTTLYPVFADLASAASAEPDEHAP